MMRMTTIKGSLIFVSLSVAMGFTGCQSTFDLNPQPNMTVRMTSINDKSKSIDEQPIQESKVMQWSANYDWQLTQVLNQNGGVVDIAKFTPITLQIEPSSVSFSQEGCEQYRLDFPVISAPPYPYVSHINKSLTTCNDSNGHDNAATIKEDANIQALFAEYPLVRLNFELLPLPESALLSTTESLKLMPIDKPLAPKRLALNIENGKRLIFTSSAKALAAPTGLPITNELLEQYDWQLVSAVNNIHDEKGQLIRKPMGNFYHPDHPISASFESWPNNQYVAFSSGCNGSRAPYFLLDNNTFKVGIIISTAMGCGETGNRIETALFDLMRDSSSKLTLSLQPIKPETKSESPRYNLLQTMATGETLVWQNADKLPR